MPAETHQQGRRTDAASISDFLMVLLGADPPADGVSLAACGVAADDLDWLWATVCEDLAERTLTPDLDGAALDPAMTVAQLAAIMAEALKSGGGDDD